MRSQPVIIRLCRHILADGRHCQGAAVCGRSCCRHHLNASTRLHNMARAWRLACVPRLRVPETPRDLAANRTELNRILATYPCDLATAKMMHWALDLTAAALPDDPAVRRPNAPGLTSRPNEIYQVPLNPLFPQSYTQNPTEVVENTSAKGEGVHQIASGLERSAQEV